MTGAPPSAVVCGLALGLGLWLLVSLAPSLRRPTLAARVAPYVTDVSADARRLLERATANPLPVFAVILDPVLGRLQRGSAALLGGGQAVERLLRQVGSADTVAVFRSRQLVWAIASSGIAIAAELVVGAFEDVTPPAAAAIVAATAAAAIVARDRLLRRRASRRLKRMARELPTVLEFMTLSLSAGEGVLDSLRRISRVSRGELARELAGVVTDVASGMPLGDTLLALAASLRLPAVTRAIEHLTGAIERGTPLVEVLRAQAQDVRDSERRELLELSGRKEVAMLFPLVFLILPTTIAIAVFPGIYVLQLGLG